MAGEPSERPARVGPLSWSEVADALWLAAVLGEPVGRQTGESVPEPGPPAPGPTPEPPDPGPEPAPVADSPPPSPTTEPEPATGHRRRPVFGGLARDGQGRGARSRGNGWTPESSKMRGGPDILRALRPLKQLRPSSWEDDVQLDEELTAD